MVEGRSGGGEVGRALVDCAGDASSNPSFSKRGLNTVINWLQKFDCAVAARCRTLHCISQKNVPLLLLLFELDNRESSYMEENVWDLLFKKKIETIGIVIFILTFRLSYLLKKNFLNKIKSINITHPLFIYTFLKTHFYYMYMYMYYKFYKVTVIKSWCF